jgi:hypothetical protein
MLTKAARTKTCRSEPSEAANLDKLRRFGAPPIAGSISRARVCVPSRWDDGRAMDTGAIEQAAEAGNTEVDICRTGRDRR